MRLKPKVREEWNIRKELVGNVLPTNREHFFHVLQLLMVSDTKIFPKKTTFNDLKDGSD